MTKWEHRTVHDAQTSEWNRLGQEGWQLVFVERTGRGVMSSDGCANICYFKRPLPEQEVSYCKDIRCSYEAEAGKSYCALHAVKARRCVAHDPAADFDEKVADGLKRWRESFTDKQADGRR